MKTKPHFSGFVFLLIAGLMAVVLWIYSAWYLQLPVTRAWRYWTAEGNFSVTVMLIGLTGFVAYKFFDWKENYDAQNASIGAMILWFLVLLALKFAG